MAADTSRPSTASTLAKLLIALLAAGVLSAGLALPYVGGLGLFAGKAAGKFIDTTCNLRESQPPLKTTILARDGKTVIATLFTQDRQPVPLNEIPPYLRAALIATEDRRFYQHHGVDMRGLIRSAVNTSSGSTQGGSTLTMQYVKQMRYFQAVETGDAKAEAAAIDQNLSRKMEDAKCAIDIEKRESKDAILDNYLNIAFFGENSYGIQTAAQTYFGVPTSKLTLAQSALLVGLLRAPSDYDPFTNRAAALERRNEVLQNLVAVGKLSQAAADKEKATPIALATKQPPRVQQGCANTNPAVRNAGFFCDYLVSWLQNVNGMKLSDLQTGGYRIVTTLDPNLQNSAQAHMNDSVPATAPMTAVLPVIDPHTGDILAMAASKTYGTGKGQTEQQVFTNYTASGASTYKVFALLAALETGVPSNWPLTTVGGDGAVYHSKTCARQATVKNGDANVTYNQTETLTTATAKSSNSFYVGLADQLFGCNLQPIVDLMTSLGMKGLQQHDPLDFPNLTYAQNIPQVQAAQELVLGNIPTSPLELTGAYAAIADNGKFNTPAPVTGIRDSSGNVVPVKRAPGTQALAPQVAAQAAAILTNETTNGTSHTQFDPWYAVNQSQIAGKTGTATAAPDDTQNGAIWFVGMTPNLVATSAVFDMDSPFKPSAGLDGQPVGQAYGDFAAEVWRQALQPSLAGQNWSWPDPNAVGGAPVPADLVGKGVADAQAELTAAGFKMAIMGGTNFACASSQTAGTIAFFGPQMAQPGSTITVCLSSGIQQYIYTPPPPKPTPPPTSGHSSPSHGGGNGGTPGGGTHRSGPPIHGHG